MRLSEIATLAWLAALAPALAAAPAPEPGSVLPGANSKDPISIEADKLVYSERDSRAIYSGEVIAIQGATKLTCTVMTILLDKPADATAPKPAPSPAAADNAAGSTSNSQVRHMECDGPVTIVSKTQVATGNHLTFDRPENKAYLIGNVSFSDGPNVTKGDRLVYDLTSGRATVESANAKGKTRVQSQLIPGSSPSPKP